MKQLLLFSAPNCKLSPINFLADGLVSDGENIIWLVKCSFSYPLKHIGVQLLSLTQWKVSEHVP